MGPTRSALESLRSRWAERLGGECAPARARGEDWRYTSLRGFDWDRAPKAFAARAETLDHPAARLGEGEGALLVVDPAAGAPRLTVRDVNAWKLSGTSLLGLSEAWESDSLTEAAFEQMAPDLRSDPFTCWAASRFDDGAFLHVPSGTVAKEPIRILYVLREEAEATSFRSVIRLAAGAHAEVIEEWITVAATRTCELPLHVSLTSVQAGAGASLSLSALSTLAMDAQSFLRHSVEAGPNAAIRIQHVSSGGSKSQHRWESVCAGEGSEIAMKLAARGEGNEHHDIWIRTHHPAPRTRSMLDAWAIAAGRSRIVFNGNLLIPPSGQGTDAYQRSRNLLLSGEATVDSVPKLEISCDDVKVAHGASVSPVSLEQLYYLRSRGIPGPEAEAMIVDGFAEAVLLAVPSSEARERARLSLGGRRAHDG